MHIDTPDHPVTPAQLGMHACGQSVAGNVRAHNEDRFLIDAAFGLAAVADGMGGHVSGELASSSTLAALVECLAASALPVDAPAPDPDATDVDLRWHGTLRLRRALAHANAQLYAENCARGHADGDGMGSTLTGLQFLPALDAIVAFHVGDSRLYRYRDGVMTQLTRDQTAYQLALESGSPGPLPPPNLLLQALGPAPGIVPDIAWHAVRDGDLYLLCSDGLHGWVPHAQIEAVLGAEPLLDAACASLVALAARHASRDNITALLVRLASTKNTDTGASNRAGHA